MQQYTYEDVKRDSSSLENSECKKMEGSNHFFHPKNEK